MTTEGQLKTGDILLNLRVKFLSDSTQAMREYDPSDPSSFPAIIGSALAAGMKPIDLADEFKVSESTISRWQRGKSIPGELVRTEVVKRLIRLLESRRDTPEIDAAGR